MCDLINEMESLLFSSHRGAVLSKYTQRVLTEQSVVFSERDGKKGDSIHFPSCDCFARVMGKKDTQLEWDCILMNREHRSFDLDGCVFSNCKGIQMTNCEPTAVPVVGLRSC